MKINIKLMFVVVIVLSLCGCTKKEKTDRLEKELYVVPQDYNITINKSEGVNNVEVYLIAKNKLKMEDLEVFLGVENNVTMHLDEITLEKMPYYVYQSYRNTDWKKMKTLRDSEDKNLEFTEYERKYEEDYKKIKKKDYNFYTLSLVFDPNRVNEDEELDKIDIKYKGKTYSSKLTRIELKNEINVKDTSDGIKGLEMKTAGMFSLYAIPNKDGVLKTPLDGMKFTVMDDVIIKNISVCDKDNVEVIEVYFCDEASGMDMKFNKDMKLNKGTEGNIYVCLKDKMFQNKLLYNSNLILDIEYEVKGKSVHNLITLHFSTKMSPYEIYADIVDGVDVLSYYTDYFYYYDE
ncbi:MAG: hypothetical protein E7262_05955 [Lachnospiraceae bacterium]|nr:hypothetical protein [Lachnospiraceae bacterium]